MYARTICSARRPPPRCSCPRGGAASSTATSAASPTSALMGPSPCIGPHWCPGSGSCRAPPTAGPTRTRRSRTSSRRSFASTASPTSTIGCPAATRIEPTACSTGRPTSASLAACLNVRASTTSSSTRMESTPWFSQTATAPTHRSQATRAFRISPKAHRPCATSTTSTTGLWTWRCARGPMPTTPTTSPRRERTCSPAAAPLRDMRWPRWKSLTSRETIPSPTLETVTHEFA